MQCEGFFSLTDAASSNSMCCIIHQNKTVENKHVLCHSRKLLLFGPGALSVRQGRLHKIIFQDQNGNLFIGKPAHLAKHHSWQQDEKMTHRGNVGE